MTGYVDLKEYIDSLTSLSQLRVISALLSEIDVPNATILKAIWRYGPRNISQISRVTKLPRSTITYRLQRLLRVGLRIEPVLRLSALGYEVVYAEIKPAKGKLIEAYKELNREFTRSIGITLTPGHNIQVKILIPKGGKDLALEFLEKLRERGVIDEYSYSICDEEIVTTIVDDRDYNPQIQYYTYDWESWFNEVLKAPSEPILLVDTYIEEPLDQIDYLVLQLLYKNPLIDYVEMGRLVNINYQTLRYHYLKHIEGRKVIIGWAPIILPAPLEKSHYLILNATFYGVKEANKYINAMYMHAPILSICKVKGENTFKFSIFIPRQEEVKFIWFHEALMQQKIIKDYEVLTLIPESVQTNRSFLKPPEELTKLYEKYLSQ
ncbi:MAG TPA: ArsR family transcriptional regulator [Desulfurococcales archaeon]|nr:ArsR family transcriptional regulator [Desulfurococcales archaeon]